jgi:hypothetical protein
MDTEAKEDQYLQLIVPPLTADAAFLRLFVLLFSKGLLFSLPDSAVLHVRSMKLSHGMT